MSTKEHILDLYYNQHLKQNEISTIVNTSSQYVSKVIKSDCRYKEEKENRKQTNSKKRAIYLKEYFKGYERPKKEQFIGSFYSQLELNTLFTLIKDDPLKIVVYLTSFYGLRRSEVLGLKWEAFNFEDKTITIKHKAIETRKDNKRVILLKDKTKNQSSYRTLPLVDDIIVLLQEHKKQIDENKKLCGNSYNKKYLDYVCVDSIGKLFRPEYVTDHFTLIMNKHKDILRKIRFHDLRHSCASLLLAKGIPMKEIQDWLGHSTYSTTANIYAHLEKDTKNKSANVLSNVLTFTDNNLEKSC